MDAIHTQCVDTLDTFDLEEHFVDKDCAWLRNHRFTVRGQEDLCDWPHIAHRCPSTCGSCSDMTNGDVAVPQPK